MISSEKFAQFESLLILRFGGSRYDPESRTHFDAQNTVATLFKHCI